MDSIVLHKTFFVLVNAAWFLYFFTIGIRAFSGIPYLFSCRWFLGLNLAIFVQTITDALFNEFGDHSYTLRFYFYNYLGLLLNFIFISFLWLKPKSYIGFNITDALLRDGLLGCLKEMGIPYEETIGGLKLPSISNELKISIQSWLGRAKIRFKLHNEELLNQMAEKLNAHFQLQASTGNRLAGIIYLLFSLFIATGSTITFLNYPFIPANGKGVLVIHHVHYEGNFKNHILQGHAVITYPNGSRYEGDTKNWVPQGEGVLTYKNGQTYKGGFKDNDFSGQGVMTFPNGARYEGEFKDSLYNGQGTFVNYNGITYKGDFKDNAFEGRGVILMANGDKYEGQVENWLGEGEGVYASSNGSKYKGHFKAGVLQGNGAIEYANGNKYEGQIQDWMAEGKGVLTYSNGTKYEGSFKADMPDNVSGALTPAAANSPLPTAVNGIDLEGDTVAMAITPAMDLNGMGREHILNLRKMSINQAPSLAPVKYEPNPKIFGQIQDGKAWWGLLGLSYFGPGKNSILGNSKESRFILNPYLLLGLAEAGAHPMIGKTTLPPEELYPKPLRLTWDKDGKWAHAVYNMVDYYKGAVRYNYSDPKAFFISDYNARDFGFNYLVIDSKLSTNISAATDQILPINQYIHVGGSCGYPGGCNNGSPWLEALRLQWVDLPARIYLKLWRGNVTDPSQQSDMDFIIDLK